MPQLTHAVGVDVGATKIVAALVDLADGGVVRQTREPTLPERGGPAVLQRCAELAREVAGSEAQAAGVGICELVDQDGAVAGAATLDWRGLDLGAAFRPLAVTLESDVRAAARAEARF